MTEWIQRNKIRRKGRPMKRREDTFIEKVGPRCIKEATERELWKAMREAYAEEAATTANR